MNDVCVCVYLCECVLRYEFDLKQCIDLNGFEMVHTTIDNCYYRL